MKDYWYFLVAAVVYVGWVAFKHLTVNRKHWIDDVNFPFETYGAGFAVALAWPVAVLAWTGIVAAHVVAAGLSAGPVKTRFGVR